MLGQVKAALKRTPGLGPALQRLAVVLRRLFPAVPPGPNYTEWIAQRVADRASSYPPPTEAAPQFDILTLTFETDVTVLFKTAETVFAQDYPHWRWVIWDNGSRSAETLSALDELARHPRVTVHRHGENLGITRGHAAALRECDREYIVLLDHDDLLDRDALRIVAWHVVTCGRPGFLYTDEDKCAMDGKRFAPSFKPAPSPAWLLDTPYTCHLSVARRDLLVQCRAFSDPAVEGTQDWDMTLRLLETGTDFVHIPEIVYTWRGVPNSAAVRGISAKPYVIQAQKTCLEQHLARRGLAEKFEVRTNMLFPLPDGHWRAVRKASADGPLVDIILPAHESAAELSRTIGHLVEQTDYPRFRLRVVGTTDGTTADGLRAACAPHWHGVPGPVRFESALSGACNLPRLLNACIEPPPGEVPAEYLALVPSGCRLNHRDWLWEALGLFELHPRAILAGGPVFNAHHCHVGGAAVLGANGAAAVAYQQASRAEPGHNGVNFCHRNVTAIWGGTWIARREALIELGGFDEGFPRVFFEVDLGARCYLNGRPVIYSPFLSAYGSSAAYSDDMHAFELTRLYDKHGALMAHDPFYSPWLSLRPGQAYQIARDGDRSGMLDSRLQHRRANLSQTGADPAGPARRLHPTLSPLISRLVRGYAA